MSLMLELVSMVRPFGHWHFLLAVCLLDLALVAVHVTNHQQDSSNSAADLQERLGEVRRAVEEQEAAVHRLAGRVREMRIVREEKRRSLKALAEGVEDFEARLGRLGKMLAGDSGSSNSDGGDGGLGGRL